MHDLNLAQLLLTRFCHDITGPIGAINNGVEFIEENSGMYQQAMSLISDSAVQAMARIQFYRYIYGILKDQGNADFAEKKALIEDFFQGDRVQLHWGNESYVITHQQCRILGHLLLLASAALIRGGDIHIDMEEAHGAIEVIKLEATGSHIKFDEALHEALVKAAHHVPDTKTIQSYMTAKLIDELDGSIKVEINEERATFHFICSKEQP